MPQEPRTGDQPELIREVDGNRRGAVGITARLGRLRPWQVSWLIAAPVAAVLVWILVTSPIGPSGSSGSGAGPGATFYVLGAETQGLQVGQGAPDFAGKPEGLLAIPRSSVATHPALRFNSASTRSLAS